MTKGLRLSVRAVRARLADRASRLIAAGGASLLVCLTLLGTYLCADLRDIAWRNAQRNGENLLSVIEEAVGHSMRGYHASLRNTARLAARPDLAGLEPELKRLVLFDTVATDSGFGAVSVTDAAGQVQITSDPDERTLPNLAGLPEFAILRSAPAADLILVGGAVSPNTGRSVLRLSRRIEAPDGAFAGIVAGTIDVAYFQALFERLRFDNGLILNVLHRDGTLLIRAPHHPGDVGRSIAGGAAYQFYRTHIRGQYLGRSYLDGEDRLYAFSNVEDLPLIMTVATNVDSIRAAWIYKAAIIVALILCLDVLTCGLTILIQREVGRRNAAEASTQAANAALSVLARTDGLTGLPNRRSYDEVLAIEWARMERLSEPLALIIVDADHFKQFNDHFGHTRGDSVLRAVADCLRGSLDCGISFRIGGEEFVVLMPGLDAEAASVAAERVRRAVVNLQIGHAPDIGGVATVSVGVASAAPWSGDTPETLFVAADAALYAAKRAGRNRVRIAPEADAAPTMARRA